MFNVNYPYEDGWYFGADNSNLKLPAFSTVNSLTPPRTFGIRVGYHM